MELPRVRHDLATKSRSHLFIYLFLFICYLWLCWVFAAALGLLSSCGAWALECADFRSCGAWAQLPHGMWVLPGPGIKLMSLALAGRFPTARPPGKASPIFLEYLLCVGCPVQGTLMNKSTLELCPRGA